MMWLASAVAVVVVAQQDGIVHDGGSSVIP